MISCLFCGKAKAEVTHLIMGLTEGVAICDECVGQAVILLVSKGWVPVNAGLRVGGKPKSVEGE